MSKTSVTIGVDIGGTNTCLGFVDTYGNFIDEASFLTKEHETVSSFVSHLVEVLKDMQGKLGADYTCKGIGIAAPHVNYLKGTIEAPANLDWGEVNLAKMLQEDLAFPIALINDANAAALGEMTYGAAKGMKNFIVITVGTGLGSGIVINGEILNGANGLAGELGHTVVVMDGRECRCGRRGCLETYVSASGLCRTALELMGLNVLESKLYDMNFNKLTAAMLSDFAREKDPLALEVFEYTGNILGRKLADVVACLDPEAIILSGGVIRAGRLLQEPTRRHFDANLLRTHQGGKVRILLSEMQDGRSAILGASLLIAKRAAQAGNSQQTFVTGL